MEKNKRGGGGCLVSVSGRSNHVFKFKNLFPPHYKTSSAKFPQRNPCSWTAHDFCHVSESVPVSHAGTHWPGYVTCAAAVDWPKRPGACVTSSLNLVFNWLARPGAIYDIIAKLVSDWLAGRPYWGHVTRSQGGQDALWLMTSTWQHSYFLPYLPCYGNVR